MVRLLLLVLGVGIAGQCTADVQIGRYTIIDTTALPEQRFPLIQVLTVTIPHGVSKNSQAVDYVLNQSGYRQANARVRSPQDQMLMQRELATINRSFENITILEMLSAIAGLGYSPVVDPINRLIAFEATYDFTTP